MKRRVWRVSNSKSLLVTNKIESQKNKNSKKFKYLFFRVPNPRIPKEPLDIEKGFGG